MSLVRISVLWLAVVFVFGIVPAADAQDNSRLNESRAIGLDSLDAGYRVLYSDGYAERATRIGQLLADSNAFYRDSLGADAEPLLVLLLDPDDYRRTKRASTVPYGFPFFSKGVGVLPADLSVGAVRDAYAPYEATASPDLLARLESLGLSYADALPIMFDAIALHELGHVQIRANNQKVKQRWFSELMSTYYAYAYMRAREPEMAMVWDVVTEAGRQSYEPTHTSLDDFNRLYTGVGSKNYIWYQNIFQDRVRELYEVHGLDFIRAVKERLADPDWSPRAASELISALDDVAPGFADWAEAYSG